MKDFDILAGVACVILALVGIGYTVNEGFDSAQFKGACQTRGGQVVTPGKVCADGDRIIDLTPRK